MTTTDGQSSGWFFVENGQSTGPVSGEVLATLVREGRIRSDTLVWRAGMAQWMPYAAAGVSGDGAAPVDGEVCSLCGRMYPRDELIAFENARVCAACKPTFVQNLKENAELPMALRYAGFWIRVGAAMIDGILMAIVQYAVLIPMFFGMNENTVFILQIVSMLVGLVVGAAYEIWMVGRYGATVGKLACRIKVVTPEGGRVGYGRATGRHFAKMLSAILYIGYIMVAFDKEKKGLHDMICNTRVVRL